MPRTTKVVSVGLATVFCLAAAGLAVGAGGKRHALCEARLGSTILEDVAGRVFRSHGEVYACARGSRAAYPLVLGHSDPSKGVVYRLAGQQLMGHFVAWEQISDTPVGTIEDLYVLNLKTARRRTAEDVFDAQFETIGDWILNSRGAVVFIANYSEVHPRAEVRANNARGTTTLAPGTTNGEFTSLGISVFGNRAYWLDNGVAKSAQLP